MIQVLPERTPGIIGGWVAMMYLLGARMMGVNTTTQKCSQKISLG